MRLRNAVLAVVCMCVTQQLAVAHPGHTHESTAPHSLSHYLFHPDHLAQWFVVGFVIAFGILLLRTIKRPAPAYARKD